MEHTSWQAYAVSAAVAIAVAGLGAWATDIGPWYYSLKKPSWQPPDWLFGPVWTSIFALAAISAASAWNSAQDQQTRLLVVFLFLANAGLNILWSVLFFTFKHPHWALFEVVLLWLSILLLIIVLAPIKAMASWLLLPYLAWVTFAAALNLSIVRLN